MNKTDKSRLGFIVICIISIFITAGCDMFNKPASPVPEALKERAPLDFSQEDVDNLVMMSQESVYLQAPRDNGEPPEVCDYVKFLRFKLRSSTYDPADESTYEETDAFFLMVPGVIEGANAFEYMARNLVYMAKTNNNLNVEVWAMDRRANCLEDTSPEPFLDQIFYDGQFEGKTYETLQEKHDACVDLLLGYYYYDHPLPDGNKFHGFLKNKEVPFLSDFGLKMNTESMFKIIQEMVPDIAIRQKKVFVGGHSLGGIHTSVFAGWDLDGNPDTLDDAGYMNCAGIFALDSIVTPTSEIFENVMADSVPLDILALTEDLTETAYVGIVDMLRKEWIPPILPAPFFDAEVMAITEILGKLAAWFPDMEATAIKDIPMSTNLRATTQLMHSRTLRQFLNYHPDIRHFRYTYEALLGVFFDDNFSPVTIIQTSMGNLTGGPVVVKEFPIPEDIRAIEEYRFALNMLGSATPLFIPADDAMVDEEGNGPLYSWADFDEIGNADDPLYEDTKGEVLYSKMESELSDIKDFARASHIGPSNLTEWYFPTRPVIDIMAATFSYGPKYGINFIHKDMVGILPKIEFVGSEGAFPADIIDWAAPNDDSRHVVTGMNHMDPMFMSANTSLRRENEIIQPLIDFARETIADQD
ncbi:MAG: hypothetical protein KJ737_13220 [Proteobacteria bacterium]|nr:hypothetical protein [Pseudomonadota bacterium]